MDAPGRLLGTKEAKESREAIAEWDSSFASFPSACVIGRTHANHEPIVL